MVEILLSLVMVICGLIVHFLKDLIRIKQETDKLPSIKGYWREHPYQSLICIVGAVVGFIALFSTGQLTPITAFGVGYMANSVADTIGKRSLDKL